MRLQTEMRKVRGLTRLACLSALLGVAVGPSLRAAETVDYAQDVRPILKQRCFACHGVLKQRAGLRLDSVAAIRRGGEGGAAIEVGKPEESELLDRVTQADASLRMPPEGSPLTPEQIERLRAWIRQGAVAPADDRPEEDPGKHWAFLPPERPPALPVRNPGWVRNPIDAFLAAEHDARGLTPTHPADPATLLRRVYLDLIGLPPSRDELHEFLRDPSDEAYARVVDRLLASPPYGERWARHWMDVWRYSDWYGRRAVPDVTNSYAMIWRWRDWIVRSLNDDRGYDHMVSMMLAADELAPGDDSEVVATGYVLRNFYRWNYNTWMKDNVEHTAKAFLGLTLQCAHCHDHKYDPLTQNDYFAFRAFFEPLEVRHDRAPGEADPGPYPKYVYGASYRPITSGLVRVMDENLDAKTYVYTRGESRNIVPGRPPVDPSVPAFLRPSDFQVNAIELPGESYYPGLKSFIRDEERRRIQASQATAEQSLAAARAEVSRRSEASREAEGSWWRKTGPPAFAGNDRILAFDRTEPRVPVEVRRARDAAEAARAALRVVESTVESAQRDRESLEATILADDVRYGRRTGDARALARAASRLSRIASEARARLELARAEQAYLLACQKTAEDSRYLGKVAPTLVQREAAAKKAAEAREALAKDSETYTPLGTIYPSRSTGRRAALARWITSRDNPLTARVAVNHLWRWHFQSPIVATTHDFGRNGKRPTHSRLLDWLAVELMAPSTPGVAPWSMKHLHRLIVTSAAYRMASHPGAGEAGNASIDPDNIALWRFPTSRMEAEVVRDSLLQVAGVLDRAIGGPDLDFNQGLTTYRRSLYFTHHGEARMPFLELYDAPDACDAYVRTVSVVPQQALALTNNALTRTLSERLESRLWKEVGSATEATGGFVDAAFEQVLGRRPSDPERAASLGFLDAQTALLAGATPPDPRAAALARVDFLQALFNHHDFVTVH